MCVCGTMQAWQKLHKQWTGPVHLEIYHHGVPILLRTPLGVNKNNSLVWRRNQPQVLAAPGEVVGAGASPACQGGSPQYVFAFSFPNYELSFQRKPRHSCRHSVYGSSPPSKLHLGYLWFQKEIIHEYRITSHSEQRSEKSCFPM